MGQKGTMVKKAESLRGDAVRWLDKNLNGKTFSQRYQDARSLLHKASAARSKLEYSFPKDMKISGQIARERAKLYTNYKDAIAELAADVEDALKQMKKLRGDFLASESAGQRAQYDLQIKKLKTRLDDLREYAKWVPADLRRREYRQADAAIAEALSPKTVPRKNALSAKERKEIRLKRDEVVAEMNELKSKRAAAKSPAKKATLARAINKLRTKRDRLKAKLKAPAETAVAVATKKETTPKKALAKKVGMPRKKEYEMVFTEAEVEKFRKKQKSMAEDKKMFAALKEARAFTKEMTARKKAGKSIAGVRRKRFEAFARYVKLGGNPERVPVNVLKAMIEEGKKMG